MLGVLAEQVGHRSLDRCKRAAEVMRDRRQKGAPEVVGLPVHLGLHGRPGEAVPLRHEGELIAEGSQHPPLGAGQRRTVALED